MQFILTGFTPDKAFRVFAFEGIAADKSRTEFTVRTDLSLIRMHGIRVQDLPLLCRGLLERSNGEMLERAMIFTEDEMRMHAKTCAMEREAAQRKKPARKSATTPQNPDASWQTFSAPGSDPTAETSTASFLD